MNRVFLGGTCNGSTWRDKLIPMLKIDYFNPVVENWTADSQDEEIRQREECNYCLYTITPRMQGVYSIAEVVDDSNKRPEKTIMCILDYDGFDNHQSKSLRQTASMIEDNGGIVFMSLEAVAEYINDTAH